RNLRVEVSSLFADLSGQVNAEKQISAPFATPTLASYYGDGSFVSDDGTVDEMSDFFADSSLIDLDAEMPYPGADFTFGRVTASFDFPGLATGSEVDLIVDDFQTIELETDGMFNFSDSTGRAFVVENGVLAVDDLSIAANGVLRGTGSNPLVIYATGNVDIQGVLDVSGEHAPTPPAITKPTIPEWGAEGNCGGGDGGAASQQTTAETWRAESGKGAFNLGTGGEGGEGSVTWLAQTPPGLAFPPEFEPDFEAKLAAGGAGGTFAMTPNESVLFDEWSGSLNPSTHDDEGSDLRLDRHTVFETGGTVDMTEFAAYFLGGEDGIRGNSWRDPDGVEPPSNMGWFGGQFGGYGMEDVIQDEDTSDKTSGFDSPWTTNPPSTGGTPPFSFAHPTNGPDAGKTNNSVFGAGTTTGDDFWGTRYNGFDSPPSLVHGELASPWAGVGGGGSGDSQVIERLDADANSIMDVLGNFFPDAQFPYGSTRDYWKGAAGGGGGGQLQIMSIGAIILGQNAQVLANGGSGNGGESVWGLTQQVSGSGGGSGGHIILQSATGLNLSAIDLGADPLTAPAQKVIQAVGGRRGWSASELVNLADGVTPDGNSDFMVGRGGAGGNGVIQVHVPEPVNDIVWHPTSQAAAVEYITHNVAGGPADTTRVEDLLNQVAAPRPYSLISVFSPITQVQTKWMDTGLANLRSPASLPGPWPGFENTLLMFDGVDFVSGDVLTTGESVSQGDAIAAGGTATATLGTNQVVLRDVTAPAPPDDLDLEFTRNPQLLVGYDFIEDSSSNQGFEIVSATYDEVTDTLTLDTSAVDGSVVLSGNPGNPAWEIRERFFRLSTSGFKDRLPSQANVNFMFQGASDSSDPATYSAWISDLSSGTLDGSRFIRIRVTFDIDAGGLGLGIASERPALEYFKLPFTW
ncbi:MAG: hypothetical protein MK213_05825, partial [Planctomycetes bacterium]|nr:hypothetical protein [Planctomycetota bacterium]